MPRRLVLVVGAAVLAAVVLAIALFAPLTVPKDAPFAPPPFALPAAAPADANMAPDVEARLRAVVEAGIAARAFPGAAAAVGRPEGVVVLSGYGRYTYEGGPAVTPESLFDVASLTKAVVTTTAAMLLYEEGALDLAAPVSDYLPDYTGGGRERVRIRHLLTHTAGLPAFRPFHTLGYDTREDVLAAVLSATPSGTPGERTVYSDFGMITLMLVVEAISEQPFEVFAETRIFDPLGMDDTGFRAVGGRDSTVVPTERDRTFRRRLVQGEVHDETAWLLGGVSGHAGLFSTAEDLARFALMLVRGGRVGGERFLRAETIRRFTARPADAPPGGRALGWDLRSLTGYSSAGTRFGAQSYGHTGFTGTSLWIDPEAELFVVLLANRVYPTRDNSRHAAVRAALADAAYDALLDPPGAARITPER